MQPQQCITLRRNARPRVMRSAADPGWLGHLRFRIMPTPEDPQQLRIRRSFNWGVLMLSDAGTEDVPELGRGSTFANTPHALGIAVRHAQDVDFEALDLAPDDVVPPAEVTLRVGPGQHEAEDFSCVLDLPSGELRIGDAEHEDAVSVPPGRYVLSVALDHLDHAQEVDVRWSPVP